MVDTAGQEGQLARASRLGLASGVLLFALEAAQGLILPFLIRDALGISVAAGWVVLMSSAGLVGLACAAHGPSMVRSISRLQAVAGMDTGLPSNWAGMAAALRLRQGMVLLTAQVLFVLLGHSLFVDLGPSAAGVISLVFLAQHLKLLAFTNFMATNGLRRLGLDKTQQAVASAGTLLMSLVVVWLAPSMLAIAAVPVIAYAALYLGSTLALRRVTMHTKSVTLAGRAEAGSLLLLALAGYLSTNSDVLLGSILLPADAQFQFGVLARVLLVPVAIAGLWSHLQFPRWCAPDLPLKAGLREVFRLGAVLGVAVPLSMALALRIAPWFVEPLVLELPLWMIAAMLINALLSSMTAALGQVLLAKQLLSFVWPTITLAIAAPLLAMFSARLLGVHAFVLGYGASSLLVLFTLWLCVRGRSPDESSEFA